MLSGLDEIDWKRLRHAYGPAGDVPAMLRKLAASNQDEREEAAMDLCSSINHQGSIYEATAATVPFLFEMVRDQLVPDRALVLCILDGISEGWTPELRGTPTDLSAWPLSYRRTAERVLTELPHRQAAHRAVEIGFPILRDLLHDSDKKVRVAAAFVVATLMDRGRDAAAALLEMVDTDSDDWCRAAAILALEKLSTVCDPRLVPSAVTPRLREILTDEEEGPDTRLCAGLALLHFGELEALPRTLALVRPRLGPDLEHFASIPSGQYGASLFFLVSSSLGVWPESRLEWIGEGMQHADPRVVRATLRETARLCRHFRWGPARLASRVAQVANAKDPDVRSSAISTLDDLGRAGFEELARLSQHPFEDVRIEATKLLTRRQAREKERLTEWNESSPAVLAPVEALMQTIETHQGSGHWKEVEKVGKAIEGLGQHGPAAVSAVERIQSQIGRAVSELYGLPLVASELRLTAIRALWKITGNADLVVPQLVKALEPDRYGYLVIEQLREIGPAARAALPRLREIADAECRVTSEGDFSGCCPDDEAYQSLARAAIRAIEN